MLYLEGVLLLLLTNAYDSSWSTYSSTNRKKLRLERLSAQPNPCPKQIDTSGGAGKLQEREEKEKKWSEMSWMPSVRRCSIV